MRGSGAFCDIILPTLAVLRNSLGRIMDFTLKPARERSGGVIRSENADMSSERSVRNTPAESPRVPA